MLGSVESRLHYSSSPDCYVRGVGGLLGMTFGAELSSEYEHRRETTATIQRTRLGFL